MDGSRSEKIEDERALKGGCALPLCSAPQIVSIFTRFKMSAVSLQSLAAPVVATYECYICQKKGPELACAPCRQAMDAFGAVQCAQCEASWLGAFDGEWECPCGKCHPDYRAAYAARGANPVAAAAAAAAAPAPANPASDDEDMGWYNEKKKEWAAYAAQLKAEEEAEEEEED